MSKVAWLDISRVGNVYRFRVGQPEAGGVMRQYACPPVSRATQQGLRRAIEEAARGGPFSLEDLGRLMNSLLVPAEIQDFLRGLDVPLILSTDTPRMPWELLFDDASREFLGVHCAVARRLVTDAEIATGAQAAAAAAEPSFLLIANPRGDLPAAEEEVQRLDDLIASHGGASRVLVGSRASLLPVQLELQNGLHYTGIHYAGHADRDRTSNQYVLLLADRTKLAAEAIRKLLRGRPFVFLNACGSDQPGEAGRRGPASWQVAEGLASAFLRGGAAGVVGARWEVDDRMAGEFALLFYEQATDGAPVGEAMRQARSLFRSRWPDDATWAAFVLYGDPTATLMPSTALFLADGALNRGRLDPAVDAACALLPVEAQRLGHRIIGTPHLFIALTKMGGLTDAALRQLGHPAKQVRDGLRVAIYAGRGAGQGRPPALARGDLSENAVRILEDADRQAREAGRPIDERSLLLSLLGRLTGVTEQSLRSQGIDPEALRTAVLGQEKAAPRRERGPEVAGGEAPEPSPPRDGQALAHLLGLSLAPDAEQALAVAVQEAFAAGYETVETPHLFIGLSKLHGGLTATGLRRQGFDPKRVRAVLRMALAAQGPGGQRLGARLPAQLGATPLAPRVRHILEAAAAAAQAASEAAIAERHVLAAFVAAEGSGTAQALRRMGIDLAGLLKQEE